MNKIAEQLRAARAAEKTARTVTVTFSAPAAGNAAGVEFVSLPESVSGVERTREILQRQLARLSEHEATKGTNGLPGLFIRPEAMLEGEAEVVHFWLPGLFIRPEAMQAVAEKFYGSTEEDLSQEELAQGIDAWVLAWEYACNCQACAAKGQWIEGRDGQAAATLRELNVRIRLKLPADEQAARDETLAMLAETRERTVELWSRDFQIMWYLLALLGGSADRDTALRPCDCGRAGCRGQRRVLLLSPAAVAALQRKVERDLDAMPSDPLNPEILIACRAESFLRAALGRNSAAEVARAAAAKAKAADGL